MSKRTGTAVILDSLIVIVVVCIIGWVVVKAFNMVWG